MDLQDENITVTIRLRRKKDLPTTGELLTREQYLNDYSSAQEDAEKVESFAHQNLLSTAEINLARRSIMLTGKLSDFETAFNIKFQNQNNYRTFSPDVQIPDELKDIIVGIFGFAHQD